MKILFALIICVFFPCTTLAQEILFAGDVTLTRNINPQAQQIFFSDKSKDRIGQANLFIWNCEFSGNSNAKKQKQFVFSQNARKALADFSFSNGVATVANNHSFDGNQQGFKNLVSDLEYNGINYIGTKEKPYFKYTDKDGINYYVLNYSPICGGGLLSFEDIIKIIGSLKKQEKRYIIVNIHDGIEKTTATSDRQKVQARKLANLDVDIINFTHSHTYIEPSMLGNSLVLWGTGNFIFGGNSLWRNRGDVRMISVDPANKTWKWVNGYNKNYVFNLH